MSYLPDLILPESGVVEKLKKSIDLSSILATLRRGSARSKARSARIVEAILVSIGSESKRDTVAVIVSALWSSADPELDEAVMSCLVSLSTAILERSAVGCGWQAFVAYVNVGCYYVVGIPAGCLLGFKFGFGAKGIWTGMIGGTVMQTLILMWVTYRTDWGLEVEKAKKRLDKWEGSPGEPLHKNAFNTLEENDVK